MPLRAHYKQLSPWSPCLRGGNLLCPVTRGPWPVRNRRIRAVARPSSLVARSKTVGGAHPTAGALSLGPQCPVWRRTLKGVHGPPCGDGPARLPLWQSQGSSHRDSSLTAHHRPQTFVRPGLATAPAGMQKSPGVACGLLMVELAYQHDR